MRESTLACNEECDEFCVTNVKLILGVPKLTRISLKGVFEEGLFNDKFARF